MDDGALAQGRYNHGMQNLLHNLNPEQLAAVTLPAQHALILAGAGSGKTRVLTTRIAWLIQTQQVSPPGILAVTFTNKAAKEMLTRLSAMLPINTRGMWIGTFHGLCNRLLRTHYRDAALPQTFQILDSQDQLSVIKRLLKANNIDDEKFPPKTVMYFINNAKDQGLRATDVEAYDAHERKMVELYQLYDDQCQREGVVDFAELLLRTYELLSRNQPLREHYQARFRHILVDEFQDTNNLQYNWLKLLAGHGSRDGGALFAVGDDDQSIYAFRGANVGNMSAFEHEFQVKNLIKLEQNYRSHGHILDSANVLDRQQQQAPGQESAHRCRPWRTGARVRSQLRPAGSAVDHRGGEKPDRRRRFAQRDRDSVPLECAVARDRACAVFRRDSVSCVWRPALLPARRGQACDRLLAADGQSAQRFGLFARGEFPHARHRHALDRAIAGGLRAVRHFAVRLGTVCGGQGGQQPGRLRQADRRRALRNPATVAAGNGARGARSEYLAAALPERKRRRRPHRESGADGQRRHPVRLRRRVRPGRAGPSGAQPPRRSRARPSSTRMASRSWTPMRRCRP